MRYEGFGLGCGSLSAASDPLTKESTAILHAAMDQGVTFLNTADFYGAGESEMAIGQALQGPRREKAYISLKFGALMAPNGALYGMDVHPSRIKNYLTHSLKRMKLDYVDLYQPARIDLGIPVEDTIGAIADLVKEGYVREVGVTQIDAETLEKAHAVHPISYVETEYSLFNRSMESDLVPTARRLGIGIVAFGILAHGLLSGAWTAARVAGGESPRNASRVALMQPGNIQRNMLLVERLQEIARQKQVTLSQLMHAWSLTKGADIIPLIGVSKLSQFTDSIRAREIVLSEEDVTRVEAAVPADEIAGSSFRHMQFRNGTVVRT